MWMHFFKNYNDCLVKLTLQFKTQVYSKISYLNIENICFKESISHGLFPIMSEPLNSTKRRTR